MIRNLFFGFMAASSVAGLHGQGERAALPLFAGQSQPEPLLVDGNTIFAVNLYGQLARKEGNLFFSPYSISSALGMTYTGSRENTAKEIKQALHFPFDPKQLPPAFKTLNGMLDANARRDNQKLEIANGLCVVDGDVNPNFKALLKDQFEAELFSGGLEAINAWVKSRTEGKIEKILDQLDSNSACVLLSAIYFKGGWQNPFKPSDTHNAPFKLFASNQVTVPFLDQQSDFHVLEKPDLQAVSLPYKGSNFSMVILLPARRDGLAKLEEQLTNEALQRWLAALDVMPAQNTHLQLPKFKLETDYDLVPPCKALGMVDAFLGSKANFSGIGGAKGGFRISQIKHKAIVEVNEEGTEVGAATAVGVVIGPPPRIVEFCADHPFLFLIRDNQTGTILFMGRMVNPKPNS